MSDLLGTIATTLSTILGAVVCVGGTTFLFKLIGTFGPWGRPVADVDQRHAERLGIEAPSPTTSCGVEEDRESTVLTKVTVALR
jgi:hypothetical protein